MQFHKLIINVTLAIAATIGLQSVAHASTKYGSIKQLEQQLAQSQTTQPEPQAKSTFVNQDGQTFFSHPPALIRASSSQLGSYVPSTYTFTLIIPQDAGQPLKAVTIAQATNVETIKFDVSNSRAFLGTRVASGSEIKLASVGSGQSKPGEVTIVFEQPVQPGSTVTVALAAQKNPGWQGVYLFGVTVYPAGENGLGQFLGYGRINFYGNSG
jgi:hypothetical protein